MKTFTHSGEKQIFLAFYAFFLDESQQSSEYFLSAAAQRVVTDDSVCLFRLLPMLTMHFAREREN